MEIMKENQRLGEIKRGDKDEERLELEIREI